MSEEKPVIWLGSTKKDIKKLPELVQYEMGYALYQAQIDQPHPSIKALKGKDLKGVYEIKEDLDKNTYRAVYVINLGDSLYILHVFQKKSKKGIATPKPDMDMIRTRLNLAKELAKNDKNK